MVSRPLTVAQLHEALKACQAKTMETEATASKKLAEAADLVSRLKLAATSQSQPRGGCLTPAKRGLASPTGQPGRTQGR